MLLNKYRLMREGGRTEERFEYAVGTDLWPDSASPAMAGIGIVEEYVSRILGHRVEFFLIQGSRLFTHSPLLNKTGLVLDLAVSEVDADTYFVTAELTDRRNVLVELYGRMSSAIQGEKQRKGPDSYSETRSTP